MVNINGIYLLSIEIKAGKNASASLYEPDLHAYWLATNGIVSNLISKRADKPIHLIK